MPLGVATRYMYTVKLSVCVVCVFKLYIFFGGLIFQ